MRNESSSEAGLPTDAPPTVEDEVRLAGNHIVILSELLLEELESCGDDELVESLRTALDGGREIIALPAESRDRPSAVAEPVSRVLAGAAAARRQLTTGGQADLLDDVGQIEAAARRIQGLAGGAAGLGTTGLPESDGGAAGPGRILVVDDDPVMRQVLVRRLERLGHTVVEAGNGSEALQTLRAEPVDLVLTDLRMPEMGGTELLEHLQGDSALREIPTIMISGADDSRGVIRAIELGAEDFLPKPFDPTLLQARVGASLEKKRLRDQQRALLAHVQRQSQVLAELNADLEARVAEQVEEIGRLSRLERFLPPQVAEILVSRGAAGERLLESHRRQVAVLFCDLRGFTAFSEVAEPEEVMGVLREFHQALGKLVHEYEATVGDFTGDGLMVFFNDPIPVPDPALRAARLACAWGEEAGGLLRKWRRHGYDLGFAAGVALGYATLGQIGFERRYDYGVVGTVVNLAGRLCGHATDGQILLSHRAYLAVEDAAVVEDLGHVNFKGLREPVQVYSLVELKT